MSIKKRLQQEKIAILIRGPAGSGKSTIAKRLNKKIPNSIHLDIDKFKHVISKNSSPIRTKISHKIGIYFLKQLMIEKFNIIVEEIFRKDYYNQVKRLLKSKKYEVITIFLTTSLKDLKKRNKKRNKTKEDKIIKELHKEIKPFKENIIIDSSKFKKDKITQIIIDNLKT